MTRGHRGGYSFDVELSHLLLHAGSSRRTPSSHDNRLTVPRPPRRRVPRRPLQDLWRLPWPSPFHQGLGTLLVLLTEASVTTLTGFASCCGPASRSPLSGTSSLRLDDG